MNLATIHVVEGVYSTPFQTRPIATDSHTIAIPGCHSGNRTICMLCKIDEHWRPTPIDIQFNTISKLIATVVTPTPNTTFLTYRKYV
jgi:hypothetical protein